MNSLQHKKIKLPDKPGVYFFKKGTKILYIGKATSLRDRTKSYFGKDLIVTRGPMILDMTMQADDINYQETDSVLEALILEASLIKKHLPKYNIKEKDDKSWNYVCITKEEIPKVLIVREKELRNIKDFRKYTLGDIRQGTHFSKNSLCSSASIFGPYTNGLQLRDAMKIIRRIFPYIDGESLKKNNKEFYKQLGLIPDIMATKPKNAFFQVLGSPAQNSLKERAQLDHSKKHFLDSLHEYKENIKNLKLFFQGKKKKIIHNFKKEMMACAKIHDFEKAGEIKKKIFALQHINDIALIKNENFSMWIEKPFFKGSLSLPAGRALTLGSSAYERPFKESFSIRIEAYDIAHMSGCNMVGVMTVIENGELLKKEYKKFIIKTQSVANDTGALEEVLSRRFRHIEWGIPDLVVVDGNIAQINVATRVLDRYQFKVLVVGVVKDEHHKARAIQGDKTIISKYKKLILLANSEAHRFAIKFYREKSRKNMFK